MHITEVYYLAHGVDVANKGGALATSTASRSGPRRPLHYQGVVDGGTGHRRG